MEAGVVLEAAVASDSVDALGAVVDLGKVELNRGCLGLAGWP